MRRILLSFLMILLLPAATDAVNYRVLSEDGTGITLEFTTGPLSVSPKGGDGGGEAIIRLQGFVLERIEGRSILPVKRFLIEVPADRGIRLQVIDSDVVPLEGVVPEVWFHGERGETTAEPVGEFAVLASVETLRKRRLALVDLYPVLFDSENVRLLHAEKVVVRLSWAPALPMTKAGAPPRPEDRYVIGAGRWSTRDEERELSAPVQRTPFEFALSGNWLKLNTYSTGLYWISYEDFTAAGLNAQNIDPATVRIFTTDPVQQPDSISHGGSFEEDYHLSEISIYYSGSSTGSMMPGEYFIFYALGVRGWTDHLDPDTPEVHYYKHLYCDNSVYWMSWDGSFAGLPSRAQSRGVAPSVSPDLVLSTYRHRIHVERDMLYNAVLTDDRWFWSHLYAGITRFDDEFMCYDVVGGGGMIRTLGYGPYESGIYLGEADCYVNDIHAGHLSWQVLSSDFRPDSLEAELSSIVEGTNTFRFIKPSEDLMYVLWYEIFYDRNLRFLDGRLDFFAPSDTRTASVEMSGLPASEELFLFDVTDHKEPVLLTGWQVDQGNAIFEDLLEPTPVHYHASATSGLRVPSIEIAGLSPGELPSLRDEICPDMVIVYHRLFRNAAMRLAEYRRGNLPYTSNPVVRAVDIEDIYDNFSGGMKDPLAIRNYMKFLYDNFSDGGAPVIDYVLLIGNCTYDPRDILGRGNDYLPVFINVKYENEGVEDHDFLVKLDDGIDLLADLSIGRMPVLTGSDADRWVDRVINYETGLETGAWRNKVIIVADDEFSTGTDKDYYFTLDAEWMTSDDGPIPRFVDYKKIYLHNYPFVGVFKPGARNDLIEEWSGGALIVNYAGHGSPKQLSDEHVLRISDLYSLINGIKQPLFLAFSCTVADLESPFQRSIGQEAGVLENGGAIAVIAGAAPTLGFQNRDLNYLYFDYLFTGGNSTETEPVGTALLMAKTDFSISYFISNNAKYVLLGDPAMMLSLPQESIEHEIDLIDTMNTGSRYILRGSVMDGGEVLSTFNGMADIVVQESMEIVKEPLEWWGIDTLSYRLPGKNIFRGSVDVTAGRFDLDFVVPLRCRTGARARVRTYVNEVATDGIGAVDTLVIVHSGSVSPNEGPPDINLYFSGQATKVKQGAILIAEISDSDGIAILGSSPQSSIFFEFDRSGYPIFVTDYFEYEHGSSTIGRVEYPLHSGFSPGEHTVIIRAFDNLGESTADTLAFEVVEEGRYTVSDVFNMPNPFGESTNFVFQLSSASDVVLRVYNLSGVEIWNHKLYAEEGFNSIYWNGRDFTGDRISNGTYLFTLEVSFKDSFNRSETVRGKVVHLR